MIANKEIYTWQEVVDIQLQSGHYIYGKPFGDYQNDLFKKEIIKLSDVARDHFLSLLDCKKLDLEADEMVIRRLMKSYESSAKLPPIIVNENNQIIDGSHRTGAMFELKYKTIEVFKRISKS